MIIQLQKLGHYRKPAVWTWVRRKSDFKERETTSDSGQLVRQTSKTGKIII
jgi:hypothetical protein